METESLLPQKSSTPKVTRYGLVSKDEESQYSKPIMPSPALSGYGSSPNFSLKGESFLEETVGKKGAKRFVYYIIYAIVNVIISAPGLYGYAAVIFNHPVFAGHMNALSKLVIWSSLVHQAGFLLFSSLDFAIGTVQDAGLIFLSAMANTIANAMLDDGETEKAIISTTLVLLSLGTLALGLVLVVIGKFGLANAVSYLPVAVVGGYLAFIGYFCVQAGVALCISESLTTVADWLELCDPQKLLLAFPGLLAGVVLAYVSRTFENEAALPLTMVALPAAFYIIIFGLGIGLEGAREGKWVGEVAPSVELSELFQLVDFSLVRWNLISELWSTWVGMVFVVSFASCLDVAAISMDMGEALDTNKELATVGIGNTMSGLTFGFTGSYIFSQTIFTYRTGVHSRWIGFLIMLAFLYIVYSPVNILEISPLFFLGATLIFIGFDLFYEWLWEIRHQVFLSEYGIIWLTFFAIQIVGIDAGIVIGVFIAIVQQMVLTAKTCTVMRVPKRSRAIWSQEEQRILHAHAYRKISPQIVTLEISGTIFFGSSQQLHNQILDDIGLQQQAQQEASQEVLAIKGSPHTSSFILGMNKRHSFVKDPRKSSLAIGLQPPKFVVLDLIHVQNLDASGTRNCFLQLAKLCYKRNIIVCCAGPTPRISWMLRSHKVAFDVDGEEKVKAQLQSHGGCSERCEKVLLFTTVQEALEFCENVVIHRYEKSSKVRPPRAPSRTVVAGPEERSLKNVVSTIIDASLEDHARLDILDTERYHSEVDLNCGDLLFQKDSHSDSFFVVLSGAIANTSMGKRTKFRHKVPVVSGAGLVRTSSGTHLAGISSGSSNMDEDMVVASLWSVGGVLGYVDFLQDQPRHFRAIASQDGTRVAKIDHSHMNLMKKEDEILYGLFQELLLKASIIDLSNCTCDDI